MDAGTKTSHLTQITAHPWSGKPAPRYSALNGGFSSGYSISTRVKSRELYSRVLDSRINAQRFPPSGQAVLPDRPPLAPARASAPQLNAQAFHALGIHTTWSPGSITLPVGSVGGRSSLVHTPPCRHQKTPAVQATVSPVSVASTVDQLRAAQKLNLLGTNLLRFAERLPTLRQHRASRLRSRKEDTVTQCPPGMFAHESLQWFAKPQSVSESSVATISVMAHARRTSARRVLLFLPHGFWSQLASPSYLPAGPEK